MSECILCMEREAQPENGGLCEECAPPVPSEHNPPVTAAQVRVRWRWRWKE